MGYDIDSKIHHYMENFLSDDLAEYFRSNPQVMELDWNEFLKWKEQRRK